MANNTPREVSDTASGSETAGAHGFVADTASGEEDYDTTAPRADVEDRTIGVDEVDDLSAPLIGGRYRR